MSCGGALGKVGQEREKFQIHKGLDEFGSSTMMEIVGLRKV
jgi:hypothetical protein